MAIIPLEREPGKYYVGLTADAYGSRDRLVAIVAGKADLHDLWLALREFRSGLPSWRKKGKRCRDCGIEVDDRADTCRTHGCGRKPKDGSKKEPVVAENYRPPKGLL